MEMETLGAGAAPCSQGPEGCQAADFAAMWRLAEQDRPYLRGVARRNLNHALRNKVDDSDIVQDALKLAVEHFHNFVGRTPEAWRQWLAAIVANQARNMNQYWSRELRRADRELALASMTGHGGEPADDGSTPRRVVIRREEAARLLAAIEQLPPGIRQVIQLEHLEGLSHAEVAIRLNLALHTVRQRWGRGLKLLAGMLKGPT
jgi:RNA polymerase sigma-70 factor (ECF subfamily)